MPVDYTQSGIGPNFEVGKGGPRIKDDAGVLQARNSEDTDFARWQGGPPLSGDDFTNRDYVDGKLGDLPSLDAYDSAGGTLLTFGAWKDVPLGTNRQIDTSQFSHSTTDPEFTWTGVSGTKVLVLGRITASISAGSATIRGRLVLDSGSGFDEVTGSRASGELTSGQEDSACPMAILTLNYGDEVKLQAENTSVMSSPSLIANSSGIIAIALKNPATGTGNTFDNRGAPITSPTALIGKSADFTVPIGLPVGHTTWFKLSSVAGSSSGSIAVYSDSARTKIIYNSNFSTTEHIDGSSWSSIPDDGTNLENDTLYCTVTNEGSVDSTYTWEMRFQG